MKQQTELTWTRKEVEINYTDGSTAKFTGSLSSCGNFFVYDCNGPATSKYCVTFVPNSMALFYSDRVSTAKAVVERLVGQEWYDESFFCADKSKLSKLSKREDKLRLKKLGACRRFLVDSGMVF